MIPGVYALSSGTLTPIPMGAFQMQEILLTAAQSLFAVALLLDMRLSVREAVLLLVLFSLQLLSPLYELPLENMLQLPHNPLRLHGFFANTYLVLAAILLVAQNKKLWKLRLGFQA